MFLCILVRLPVPRFLVKWSNTFGFVCLLLTSLSSGQLPHFIFSRFVCGTYLSSVFSLVSSVFLHVATHIWLPLCFLSFHLFSMRRQVFLLFDQLSLSLSLTHRPVHVGFDCTYNVCHTCSWLTFASFYINLNTTLAWLSKDLEMCGNVSPNCSQDQAHGSLLSLPFCALL